MLLHWLVYLYLIRARVRMFNDPDRDKSCRVDDMKLPPPFTDPSNYPKIVYRLVDSLSPPPNSIEAYDFDALRQFPLNVSNSLELYSPTLAHRLQRMNRV